MTADQEDFENTLVFRIQKTIDNVKNIKIRFNDDQLMVPGNDCRYMASNFQGNHLKHRPKHKYRTEFRKPDNLDIQDVRNQGHPIDKRLWETACHPHGSLLPECRQDGIIRLRQWPDVARLHDSPDTPCLTLRPISIKLATRILHIPLAEPYPSYNAGHSRTTNRHCDEIRLKPHRSASIIRTLFDRFSLSHT